ncbi:hypothetical protein MKW94_030268 [Papaver nudicaule]|uniref:SKP1-like protein n=1 Tax=Papaver nudicaule TaxID=74823 RepID=A0AA41VMZ2_PAPNU|nr:hypothetical protein [Papaver nudicaule]
MIAEQKETDNIFIPLTDITGNILAKVIEFLNKHAEVETSDEDKKIWDAQFVNFEGTDILRDVAAAADDLDIDDLILLTGQRVFNWIKGKTPEVIRQTFMIGYQTQISSTPPEKEENIRRRNGWAFETYSVLASTNLQQQRR